MPDFFRYLEVSSNLGNHSEQERMEAKTIENLIEKYLQGKASLKERIQVDNWYMAFDFGKDLYTDGSLELDEVVAQRFSELKLQLGIITILP